MVNPIVYMLVNSGRVSLRELYNEYDASEIVQLTEIVCCENYNKSMQSQMMTEQLNTNKRR